MARVAECLGGAYEEAGEEELRHEEGGRHLLRHLRRYDEGDIREIKGRYICCATWQI